MFLGKFPQLQKLYTTNEITEGLNILSLSYVPKLSKSSSLSLSIQRSHSQPSMSYLERRERELRIVHRFQVLATIPDSDAMNAEEESDEGLLFKPGPRDRSASKKRPQEEEDKPSTVFVGNISYRMTARDLKKFFMKFGCVTDARVVKDHITKLPRGIAFVTFENKVAATMAIEAPPEERSLDGREMRVFPAREKRMKLFKKEMERVSESVDPALLESGLRPGQRPAVSRLNDDTLLTVFSYLKLDDLYEAQHVCHRWKRLATRCWAAKRVLDFSNSFNTFGKRVMSVPIFREVLQHCGANVRVMDLSAVSRALDYSSIELIAKVCHNLEDLNVSRGDVTTIGLKEIAKNCTKLKAIALKHCINIGEKGLWWLLHLRPNLTHIDLTGNMRISGKCFYHLGPNLTVLNLSACIKIVEYGFEQIGQRCPALTELSLECCASLTDSGLRGICSGCPGLRKLSLCSVSYPGLSEETIGCIGQLKELRELILYHNSKVEDEALIAISRGCTHLEVLNVACCGRGVTDDSVQSFDDCPNLRILDISYLENVTDNALRKLAKVGRLEEVSARACISVDNDGCQELVALCPRLRLLDVSGCEEISALLLDSCLKAAETREEGGPQLRVIVGGTGVDTSRPLTRFIHPLLNVDTSDLSHDLFDPSDYRNPDFDKSEWSDLSTETPASDDDDGGGDDWTGEERDFLDAEDPMLEFERDNLS